MMDLKNKSSFPPASSSTSENKPLFGISTIVQPQPFIFFILALPLIWMRREGGRGGPETMQA